MKIDEDVIYTEITKSDRSIWSFMLMSGYLKPTEITAQEVGTYCTLQVPNKEVYFFFRNMMESWFVETIRGGSVQEMRKPSAQGEVKIL